ncbi:MAG TPA: hypothetical protein VJA40_02580 [archaeon]|nr:hypothetical protein [archaeon]
MALGTREGSESPRLGFNGKPALARAVTGYEKRGELISRVKRMQALFGVGRESELEYLEALQERDLARARNSLQGKDFGVVK